MTEKIQGLIIYIKKIKDNDLYIRVLTQKDELLSGLVYGGNSSKKKYIHQLGYFIEFSFVQKNTTAPKNINADLIQPFINTIMNNKFKSYSLLSIISLINQSILEGQKLAGIYDSVNTLIKIISSKKNWLSYYCEWIMSFLKIIGYEIDYKNQINKGYFNFLNNEFSINQTDNSIEFPHKLFVHENKINFHDLNNFFWIFENIYKKNHLDNLNYKMPINFINFKEIVLKELKNK